MSFASSHLFTIVLWKHYSNLDTIDTITIESHSCVNSVDLTSEEDNKTYCYDKNMLKIALLQKLHPFKKVNDTWHHPVHI